MAVSYIKNFLVQHRATRGTSCMQFLEHPPQLARPHWLNIESQWFIAVAQRCSSMIPPV